MAEGNQRATEKVYARKDYRRVHDADIGKLIYPGHVVEQFVERLGRAVERDKTSGATIVVDFHADVAGRAASRVFSRLGVGAVVVEGFATVAGAVGRVKTLVDDQALRSS